VKIALAVFLFSISAFGQNASLIAACGPQETQFRVDVVAATGQPSQPQTDPAKALVYVIEDQKYKLMRDVTTRVGVDGAWVGANRGNSYLFFAVPPGEHHLCTDWTSDFVPGGRLISLTSFTAEAGQTYYFRARTSGAKDEKPAIDLDPLNTDEGKFLVASLRLSDSKAKK
jgi:hypothetical protein